MRLHALLCLTAGLIVAFLSTGGHVMEAAPPTQGGAIKGHIRLSGKAPGNSVIRMGVDPMCAKINAGKQVVQEAVVTSADGGLANVFVTLEGPFPQTPAPPEPVSIDQQGCIYHPRVVGARVGQLLQIRNSDGFLHNVHSLSSRGNSINLSEPGAGCAHLC